MRKQSYILILITGIAFFLRMYGLSAYSLNGDEYFTVSEAESIGLNWNSILYYFFMQYWILLDSFDEFWLRFPSVVFGVLTVPLLYKTGAMINSQRAGVILAILAAISPFHIFQAQNARFYTFFIYSSTTFLMVAVYYVNSRKTVQDHIILAIAAVVLISSHFLGILVLLVQVGATIVALRSGWSRWVRMLVITTFLVGCFLIPFIPGVVPTLWFLYKTVGNSANSLDPVIAPISVISFAKLAIAGYVFGLGYHVYPLWLWVVLPGVTMIAILFAVGLIQNLKNSQWASLPVLYLIALVGVYTVLDAVGGRLAGGVSPRHAAFFWPVFLLIVALGLDTLPRRGFYVVLPVLLMVNLAALWPRWTGEWVYGSLKDYRAAGQFAYPWLEGNSAILHDGRSAEPIEIYFPESMKKIGYWSFLQQENLGDLKNYNRLVFVTNDFQAERRQEFTQLLRRLDQKYAWVDGQVDYPLFEYVLQRKSGSSFSAINLETDQLRQPLDIYGLEFQDLRLPVEVTVDNVPLKIIGSFGLPDMEELRERSIDIDSPILVENVILLSTVINSQQLQAAQPVAELVIETPDNSYTLPLRLGHETEAWDNVCSAEASCETVYQWHKRIAFVGQRSYPDAWRDFQAGIHATTLTLPEQTNISQLTFRYRADAGQLYIWAVALSSQEPDS